MFHAQPNPTYAQLQIDNNLAKIYYHIVSKSTSLFFQSVKVFAKFLLQLCQRYDKIEYLSQTESDTHMTCLRTLKILTEFAKAR
jgi:hypothetical protein